MQTETITVATLDRRLVDLTAPLEEFCRTRGNSLVNVFAPHSTVGLALVHTTEGSGEDLLAMIHRLAPRDTEYRHTEKSPGHGADHLIPALLSPSLIIPVAGGRPLLGTYQELTLIDLDTDTNEHRVTFSFLAE